MTASFNIAHAHTGMATFDARVVSVDDIDDVVDYLVWRQADTYRNAVGMAARAWFSHKELKQLNVATVKAKLLEATGVDEVEQQRQGTVVDEMFAVTTNEPQVDPDGGVTAWIHPRDLHLFDVVGAPIAAGGSLSSCRRPTSRAAVSRRRGLDARVVRRDELGVVRAVRGTADPDLLDPR